MSRRCLVALFLAVPVHRAGGQTLAGLERRWEDARVAAARVDSLARSRMRSLLDTSRAGNLIVLAPVELGPLAVASAPPAWSRLAAVYGDEAHPASSGNFVIALYRSDTGVAPYGFPPEAIPVPVASRARDAARLATQIDLVLSHQLRKRFDPPLNRWISSAVTTASADSAPFGAFEDLVTSPSTLARSCYVGALSACGAVLGLIAPHDAAAEWYDAAGRRELVRHNRIDRAQRVWFEQCVEQAVDEACLHVLHGPDSTLLQPPLMAGSRELMVRIALRLGGPQAFHRLLGTADQPIARRLEAASGVTLDSLLIRWHATILAARPPAVVMTLGIGWTALAWSLSLGVLVLCSSRWRL